DLLSPSLQFILNRQGHFQCERAHSLDEQIADRAVECAAHDALADRLRMLDALTLAGVLRQDLVMADVVADGHASAAPAAHRQTLKQRWPFSWRAMPSISAIRLRVIV